MLTPITIDVSTGENILTNAIQYEYPLLLEERSIHILAYSIEMILAEKMQTILSRNTSNTRMRDYYDVYILQNFYREKIDMNVLRRLFDETCSQRKSTELLSRGNEILDMIKESENIRQQWKSYQFYYPYVSDIEFEDIIHTIRDVLTEIKEK